VQVRARRRRDAAASRHACRLAEHADEHGDIATPQQLDQGKGGAHTETSRAGPATADLLRRWAARECMTPTQRSMLASMLSLDTPRARVNRDGQGNGSLFVRPRATACHSGAALPGRTRFRDANDKTPVPSLGLPRRCGDQLGPPIRPGIGPGRRHGTSVWATGSDQPLPLPAHLGRTRSGGCPETRT